jgi:hypothetical protein
VHALALAFVRPQLLYIGAVVALSLLSSDVVLLGVSECSAMRARTDVA